MSKIITELPKKRHRKRFAPKSIKTDAERIQFKAGGDKKGVTGRLRSINLWDPMLAGLVIVWQTKDGTKYIVDGHQRLERAKELKTDQDGNKIQLEGYLIKETDGWTVRHARIAGALKNIAEDGGSTNPLDVARILKNDCSEELLSKYISKKNGTFSDGKNLAKLCDDVFGIFLNTPQIPLEYGAELGRILEEFPEKQRIALDYLRKVKPESRLQIVEFVEEVKETATEELLRAQQPDMFGDVVDLKQTPFYARYRIKTRAIERLTSLAGTFSRVGQEAETLSQAGVLDVRSELAQGHADVLRGLQGILKKQFKMKGPVSDALDRAVEHSFSLRDKGVSGPFRKSAEALIQQIRNEPSIACLLDPIINGIPEAGNSVAGIELLGGGLAGADGQKPLF